MQRDILIVSLVAVIGILLIAFFGIITNYQIMASDADLTGLAIGAARCQGIHPARACRTIDAQCGPYQEIGDTTGDGLKNQLDAQRILANVQRYNNPTIRLTNYGCNDLDRDGAVTMEDFTIATDAYVLGKYNLPILGFTTYQMRYVIDCNLQDPFGMSKLTAKAIAEMVAGIPAQQNHFYGLYRNYDGRSCDALDANQDGILDINDAAAIERMIA